MENTRYPFWPLPQRPPLKLPNDARIAVWLIPNIEHFRPDQVGEAGRTPGSIDLHAYAERDYGNRVGVWRIMDVLDKYGARATVALNADVCRFERGVVEAGVERRWEWMGHGMSNSQRLVGLDEAAERQLIGKVAKIIKDTTGTAPRGWLGPGRQQTPNTVDLLVEAGFSYLADWAADELPFPVKARSGHLVALPYSNISDISGFVRWSWHADDLYRYACEHFDTLYEEAEKGARIISLAVHPYLTGRPPRIKWLDKSLKYITSHKGVWLTTGGEIADWYQRDYFAAAVKEGESLIEQRKEDST